MKFFKTEYSPKNQIIVQCRTYRCWWLLYMTYWFVYFFYLFSKLIGFFSPASLCSDPPLDITAGRRDIVYGNGTSHDSIISFACDQNYQLIGSSRIVCASGIWSFNVPSCQRMYEFIYAKHCHTYIVFCIISKEEEYIFLILRRYL